MSPEFPEPERPKERAFIKNADVARSGEKHFNI